MLLESMIGEENKKSNRKKKIPVQKSQGILWNQVDSETCGTRGSSASVWTNITNIGRYNFRKRMGS